MEQITEEKKWDEFLEKYETNFTSYAKHKTEAWILNTIKSTCSEKNFQSNDLLYMVSDFAQNLKIEKRKETAEEYFHKRQIVIEREKLKREML